MYRTALVALKPGSSNEVATSLALALAVQNGMSLVGISVIDPQIYAPPEPVPLGASEFKVDKDREVLARTRNAANAALDAFASRCQTAGVAFESICREGRLDVETARTVQGVDVLVVGHGAKQGDVAISTESSAMHRIVSNCPRPVIVVPSMPSASQKVLIAYDGSMQASRALQAFVESGLQIERELHLLAVCDDSANDVISPAVEFLKRHRHVVEVHTHSCRSSVADDILGMAHQLPADLLVMGAYGKTKLVEFFFGSVTQRILAHAKIPVFLVQ